MKITTGQLRQIIREEIRKQYLKEAIDKNVLQVFGYAGIKTKYQSGEFGAGERYGDKVVQQAEKLAPKYIDFAKKIKALLKDKTTKELGAVALDKANYGGRSSVVGSPIDGLVYVYQVDANSIDKKFSSFVKTAKKLLDDPMMDDFVAIATENSSYSGSNYGGQNIKQALEYINSMK